MSYCRWSSDDFRCDLYCYEDCSGGYTTHIANNRVVGDIPKQDSSSPEAWVATHKAQMDFLRTAGREAIALPHAGETFNDPTLAEFRARLVALLELGYRFPDYVFDEIDAEMAEAHARGNGE